MTRRVPHSRPGAVSFFAKTCSWRQTVVWRKTVGTKTAPGVLQRTMHATFLHCFGFWRRLSSCWHAARIHLASGLHVVVMQLPSSSRLARMRLAPRLHLACIRLASSLHIGRIRFASSSHPTGMRLASTLHPAWVQRHAAFVKPAPGSHPTCFLFASSSQAPPMQLACASRPVPICLAFDWEASCLHPACTRGWHLTCSRLVFDLLPVGMHLAFKMHSTCDAHQK